MRQKRDQRFYNVIVSWKWFEQKYYLIKERHYTAHETVSMVLFWLICRQFKLKVQLKREINFLAGITQYYTIHTSSRLPLCGLPLVVGLASSLVLHFGGLRALPQSAQNEKSHRSTPFDPINSELRLDSMLEWTASLLSPKAPLQELVKLFKLVGIQGLPRRIEEHVRPKLWVSQKSRNHRWLI